MGSENYPYDILAVQHSGYLTDNAPPSTKSCEMLQKWNEKYEWPKLRTAVASEFFKTVESQYADRIETVRGAWPDWWTDGFASAFMKAIYFVKVTSLGYYREPSRIVIRQNARRSIADSHQ